MLEYATYITNVLYLFFAFFFAYISVKCFFEKISIKKIIIILLLSPATGYLLSFIIISVVMYSNENYGKEKVTTLIFYGIIQLVLQIIIYLILMLIYVKLTKAINPSFPIFIYTCLITLIPGSDYLNTSFQALPILCICYVLLCIMFYKLVVKPVAELSKTKQITDLRLFIILPAMTGVFNIAMYTVYTFTWQIISSGELLASIRDFNEKTGLKISESIPLINSLIRYIARSYAVFIIPSIFISIVLIIAFHVIIKNVKFTNELYCAKDEIKELSVQVMEALAHTIDAKDEYTRGHSIRVAKYSRMIAEKMGLSKDRCEDIYYMGLLHDIGKIGVPNEIINKPSKLTDEEYGVIKKHPVTGFDILAEIKCRPDLSTGARWHHERYDGTGYPDHKAGEEIPLEARIIAVADSYDAMTSNRSYRNYLPQNVVREELENNIGTQFDEKAAKCMIEIIDEDKEYILHE